MLPPIWFGFLNFSSHFHNSFLIIQFFLSWNDEETKQQQQLCSRYYVEDRSSDINVYFSLDLSFFDFGGVCACYCWWLFGLFCFVFSFCLFGLFPQLSFLYWFCRYWFKQKGDVSVCASSACGMNATPKKAKLFITTMKKNCGKKWWRLRTTTTTIKFSFPKTWLSIYLSAFCLIRYHWSFLFFSFAFAHANARTTHF